MTETADPGARHGRLWIIFGATLFLAFFILGFFGREVYRQAPPIPSEVRTSDGLVVMSKDDILTGQQVWQSTGGQQLGSIWGHGAYQAPDWTADWLHRESEALLALWSVRDYGTLVEGHGGVLDRIDAICFAAPVFYHVSRQIFKIG